jgi:hypothetical protein
MNELPPIEFLDMAAKAANWVAGWEIAQHADSERADEKASIIAHARTLQNLAALDPSIMPIDPDRECLVAIYEASGRPLGAEQVRDNPDDEDRAAIAVIKAYREAAVAKALAERGLA